MLFLGCVLIEVVVYYFPDSNQQPQLESNPRTKCSNSNISEYFQQGQFPMGWTIMLKKKATFHISPHKAQPNQTKEFTWVYRFQMVFQTLARVTTLLCAIHVQPIEAQHPMHPWLPKVSACRAKAQKFSRIGEEFDVDVFSLRWCACFNMVTFMPTHCQKHKLICLKLPCKWRECEVQVIQLKSNVAEQAMNLKEPSNELPWALEPVQHANGFKHHVAEESPTVQLREPWFHNFLDIENWLAQHIKCLVKFVTIKLKSQVTSWLDQRRAFAGLEGSRRGSTTFRDWRSDLCWTKSSNHCICCVICYVYIPRKTKLQWLLEDVLHI